MAYYENTSNINIIYDSFRTSVEYDGYFDLINKLTEIAETHGDFLRLNKRTKYDGTLTVDVVANKDQGYLLGELVQERYEDDNLLYCEQVEADGTCIVVCICNGTVLIETVVSPGLVSDEIIIALITSGVRFRVVVAGSIFALDWVKHENSTLIPPDVIETSERKPQGFLVELASPSKMLLNQPLGAAVSRAKLQPFSLKTLFVAAAIILSAVVGFNVVKQDEVESVVASGPVDLFKSYRTALESPSPSGNVLASVHMLALASIIPGWGVKEVGVSQTNTYAEMVPTGGSVADLESYAAKNNMVVRRKGKSNFLYGRIATNKRNFHDVIFDMQDVTNHISDIVNVTYNGTFTPNEMVVQGKVLKREASVELKDAIFDDMTMFAESLADLPIVLNSVSIKPNKNTFLMSVNIVIYGEKARI
tara:strand:- start:22445 stop:23704 length:1260 start_codon:yes stop_codon:yes gene_type:complete